MIDKILKKIFLFFFICCITVGLAFAVEDIFTVSIDVISADNDAPSTPVNLNLDVISSSQIDLTWDNSTDNIGVSGYRIFRDDIFLATSTLNYYSDIGLSSGTTYSYNVQAFDASLNFSSTSATSLATTFSQVSSASNPTSGTRVGKKSTEKKSTEVYDLVIFPEEDFATIKFNTTTYTKVTVYWGDTFEYKDGVLAGSVFQLNHEVRLEDLIPNTHYYVMIDLVDGQGVFKKNLVEFNTKKSLENYFVSNVSAFNLKEKNNYVELSWKKKDDQSVRIIRSTIFFPVDPYDGKLIYEGSREDDFLDEDVEDGVTYYYTIFTKDDLEQYSSGVTNKITLGKSLPKKITSGIPYSNIFEEALSSLSIVDFEIIQNNKKLSFVGGGVSINGDSDVLVKLPAIKVPQGVKTITFTFDPQDSKNNPVTFLLQKKGDEFVGSMFPLKQNGIFEIEINIFDSTNKNVKTIYAVSLVKSISFSDEVPSNINIILEFLMEHILIISVVFLVGIIGGIIARLL